MSEITTGIIVTIIQIGLLIYAMYKIDQVEEESPTESLVPE
jgi:hypothetical protein